MTDKSKILAFPDTAAIDAEAAAWVARFDAGDVSAKEQAEFQEWLNRSALHRGAIAEYGNLWSEFDTLKRLTGGGEAGEAPVAQDTPLLVRARPWLAACAAVAIVSVGGVVFFQPEPKTHQAPVARIENPSPTGLFYESAVGVKRRITLADGTSVILNTNSRLDVNFSANRRDVRLVRGEA
jgi:transmembrane sensor